MCGIAGIWRFGRPLRKRDETDIDRMVKAIAHRGPDGENTLIDDDLAFGHRRLSILDRTERAAQPMRTKDGLGALVYNGEVYNYPELRVELEESGVIFRSTGDTEVVLYALHHWGPEKAIARFNGMFALAYHDRRDGTLWLARDRLGIKPLSLSMRDNRLVFASEDKGILAADTKTPEIDRLMLVQHYLHMNEPNGSSMFTDIDRVQPGTILKFSGKQMEESFYWNPVTSFDPNRLAGDKRSNGEKQSDLRALIEASVEMHLAADTPLATCLSGGVDSGLITAIAKSHVDNLRAYVADPDTGANEVGAATLTARHVGVDLKPVKLDRDTYLRTWPETLWALESPSEHASDPALLAIARQSYKDGIPVLLTGEGSDELFGGYMMHTVAARRWRFADPPFSWFRNKTASQALRYRLATAPAFRSLIQVGNNMRSPGLAAMAPFNANHQMNLSIAAYRVRTNHARGLIASSLHDLSYHLQGLLNRHDRLAMAASVEMRVPFLESGMIDFGMHLPPKDLQHRGIGKYLLKQVASRYLPRANIYKRKLGFPMTLAYTGGTEKLMENGLLQHTMRWRKRDLDAAITLAKAEENVRHLLVGSEVLARLYIDGESADALGEKLVALARDQAVSG